MTFRRLFVAAVFVAATVALPALAVAAKDYRAERFDVNLAVEPGGTTVVTERIRFVFGGDSFTYVYRGLPSRRTDGVTIVAVAMDGRPFTPGDEPGQFEVKRQDSQRRVVWHFEEISRSAHTFELTYRVSGLVRYEAAEDLLEWYALPTKHVYPIGCASVEIHTPEGTVLQTPATVEPAAQTGRGTDPIRFERCGFDKDDSWLVRARFAARSIVSGPPAWQRRAARASRYLPLFLGLTGMILLAGIGGFAAFGMQHRSPLQGDSGRLLPEPPDSLPPDLAAVLTRAGSVTWPVALATLFGLASRGVIRIDEIDGGSVFRKQDFAITPHRSVTSLRPSERALYDLLFSSRKGSRTMLKFSELGGAIALSRSWKTFAGAVKDELREQHIFDEERGRIRRRGTIVGIFVAVSGLVLLIAAVPFVKDYGGASLMIGVATAIVGVVGISIAQSLTPLTDEAIRRASLWRAYGRHLRSQSKNPGRSATAAEAFARALPAAVAFGAAVAWAKGLEKNGVTAGPAWMGALPHEGGGSHMAATIAMLSSSHAAGAQAGHNAAGASAGAAGGGSSGAG